MTGIHSREWENTTAGEDGNAVIFCCQIGGISTRLVWLKTDDLSGQSISQATHHKSAPWDRAVPVLENNYGVILTTTNPLRSNGLG